MTAASCVGRTRLLVLQPTPFCNIDCSYCYLPDRTDRHRMPLDVVEAAVRFVFDAALPAPDFTIVWHAGEPLVVPPEWYKAAFARISSVTQRSIPHAMQTNGMLIDPSWCDLFLEHEIRLGVSLDGPAWLHDSRRRTRSGLGTHARVMKGIDLLRRRNIPFHVICVVGDKTLDVAQEIVDFFVGEGIYNVGFNIDEVEGANRISSLHGADVVARFRRFFHAVIDLAQRTEPLLAIREQREVLSNLRQSGFGDLAGNSQNEPFGFVSVSSRGALYTFSPELAGLKDPVLGDLSIGQLPGDQFADVLKGDCFQRIWRDIQTGVEACRSNCVYFNVCLGGAPSNKLAEHGTFTGTETLHCQLTKQVVADVILADIEARLTI
ncbi:uncharacterized protein EV560_11643 [Bosea sp. BK604]|nr:uncharacterized protein EV560_11643 [Bosea sp. BK604]